MSPNIIVSLFDYSGVMVQPWLDDGYECYIVDIQHNTQHINNLHKVHADLSTQWNPPFDKDDIAFVAAFPPCDHLAVSGARWFKGKGLRKLQESIGLFAAAAEFCEWANAPYFIENPISTISTYWRKPDYIFHPYYFTGYNISDNYTKKTCLWTGGGFIMPDRFCITSDPDNRIHACPPSDDRKNIRSKTPPGFAKAVYYANSRCK